MNSLLELLNRWGDQAIPVAGQILWQTSLLIIVLLALDLLLRHRIRAGFRYALWMLLLVKLVLPPSFALPTGAGYWIERPAKSDTPAGLAASDSPLSPTFVEGASANSGTLLDAESFDLALAEAMAGLPSEVKPIEFTGTLTTPLTLTLRGQLVATWLTGTLLLLGWMLWRWRWVSRLVQQSEPAPAALQELAANVLPAACQQPGRDRRSARSVGTPEGSDASDTTASLTNSNTPDDALGSPRRRDAETRPTLAVRLTDTAMSPAVCGLFRPVILLPRKLVNRLTEEQLRSVLLHELVHLRRHDLGVNCLQTLLQIVAWWHPLLWVANARIRRVREEAVDEAVACALRDEADAYPATLLEVAKLTFTRPLLTLGLVGILESKHALKQRIRRLLELPPLESTRLKWWQWAAVAALALTALPMAEGQRQPAVQPLIEAATAPSLASRSGISYDQRTDLATWDSPNPTGTITGYERQLSNKSWPVDSGRYIQARKYAQALQSTPSPITVDVWAVKLDRRAWAWLTKHPDSHRVEGQTNAYIRHGTSLDEWLGTQEGVEKLEGGRFPAQEHHGIVVGEFSPDRRTIEPYSQARIEVTSRFDDADRKRVWLKLDSIIDWSGETWKSRKVYMPSPGGNSSGAGEWVEAFERARGYVKQQYKTDGTLVGLGDWLILGEPFDRQTIEPIFAVVVQPLLAQAATVDQKEDHPGASIDRDVDVQELRAPAPASATGRSWGAPVESSPDWPGWGARRPSPPYVLESTNLNELGHQMITAQAPFPDPRSNGYRSIGLEPRFLLTPVEGLIRALGGRLLADRPLIVAPTNLVALTNSLIEAGAVDHSAAEPMKFSQMSGGVFHWQVARGEPSQIQFQTIDRPATDAADVYPRQIVFGARHGMTAYVPDWVPLTLLARPFANDDASLHCLLSLATGDFKPAKLVKAEETIPLGASLVWASTNEVRSGFAQVVVLHNSGEPKTENSKAAGEAEVETREESARRKIRNASALIDGGKLDDAESLLREAAKDDPGNSMVSFHLAAIERARSEARADRGSTNGTQLEGRPRIMQQLNKITLPELKFEGLPLKEVVKQLQDESVRQDAAREGVAFMIVNADPAPTGDGASSPASEAPSQDIGETVIDINPPLKDLRLIDALNAVVMAADRRIKFVVEDFAVVFTPRLPEKEPLETREFRVNPNTFYQSMERVALNMSPPIILVSTNPPARPASEQTPVPAGDGVRFPTTTNDMSAVNAVVRAYFEAVGVDLKPPKSLFFNDRKGILLVRATLADLEIIQNAVELLNYEPPQIMLEARCYELKSERLRELGFDWFMSSSSSSNPSNQVGSVTGILTAAQFKIVLAALESDELRGTMATNGWRVTTLSGRQTQIKSVAARTLVTGVTNTPTGQEFVAQDMEFGKVLDIKPVVGPEGYTVDLTVQFNHSEFLGYNDPAPAGLPAGTPLPQFLVRSANTKVSLWDGQTLVLGGMTIERPVVHKSKVPVLGSIPLIGRAFRSEMHETETRHLLVFITPTIIDPAGNPVHLPGYLPLARELVPPPPNEP